MFSKKKKAVEQMTKPQIPLSCSDPFNCSPVLTAQFVSVVSKLPHQNHTKKLIKITTFGPHSRQRESAARGDARNLH